MKKLFIILLALYPAFLIAQPNYHAGYVLKNNGDTLKGFINYREWSYSPEFVEFKADNNSPVLRFTADGIKEFAVNGFVTYRAFVGDITMNKNVFPNISSGIDTSHLIKAIFMKPVRTGATVSLFYNNEVNKDRFFVTEGNSAPIELKYYEYYTSGSTEAFGNIYKTQSLQLAEKYNRMSNKITLELDHASFDLANIAGIVDEINGTGANKPDSAASAKQARFIRFIAGVAGNYSSFSAPSSKSFTPEFNAGVDVFFNPNVQQIILRVELGYTQTNGNTPVDEETNSGIVTVLQPFTEYTFSVTPQIIFNVYNTDKFKVYVDGGARANFSSYSIQNSLRAFWVSLPLQTGVVFSGQWEAFVSYAFKGGDFDGNYGLKQNIRIGVKHLF